MSSNITDARVGRSRATVLAETYRQLARTGLGGFSVDEVARVSGVSKTTIYRHWPNRAALILDACSRLGETGEIPDMGSIRTELDVLMTAMVAQLENTELSVLYPSIIDAAGRDDDVAKIQADMHRRFMAPISAIVERARARGEVSADTDTADLAATLLGPVFYRKWFSKEPISYSFVCSLVEGTVAASHPDQN